jgi:hypothetical protein
MPHLALCQDFATTRADADLPPDLGPCLPARAWFGRVVAYGLATRWGQDARRRPVPPEPVEGAVPESGFAG